jgi:NADH-quinone oxidoreductase subunit B
VEVGGERAGGREAPSSPPGGTSPREPHTLRGGRLRISEHSASQLLRGSELRGPTPAVQYDEDDFERHVRERVLTTTLDRAVAWARSNSFFPATFGLACCAIEMITTVASRVDIARFGFEAFRASPRQADLIILSGRVSIKMAPIIRRLYDQMLEPKWAISMGACCSSMGVFNNYALVPADKFMPIDVHVPGCPPRPEALMHGVLKLRKLVQDDPEAGWRERYGAVGTEELLPPPHAASAGSVPPRGN